MHTESYKNKLFERESIKMQKKEYAILNRRSCITLYYDYIYYDYIIMYCTTVNIETNGRKLN